MGEFKYVPPHEVDARHKAARPKTSSRETRQGTQRNVQAVLAIGSVRYFTYRGWLFAIPPVPYKAGQQILNIYVKSLADASQVVKTGSEEATAAYYAKLEILAKLLWKYSRPITRLKRILKSLGLMRNVFLGASERELQVITDFFLKGRMMSSVQATEMDPVESTSISSMNSKSS